MAAELILQTDGAPVEGANAYADLDFATAYFANVGAPPAWVAATNDQRTQALIAGASWLDDSYRWIGSRNTYDLDRMEWCRYEATTDELLDYSDVVPLRVKQGNCLAAAYHLEQALNEAQDRGGAIEEAVIGPLEVKYSPGAPGGRTFPALDLLVRSLIVSAVGGSVRKLARH